MDEAEAARSGSGFQGAHSFNVLAVTVFCVTLGASFYGTFTGDPVRFPVAPPEAPALRGTLPAADFESGAHHVTRLQSL